ncbi:MAG: DoxX family protein [Saprospiraceae bacterium]
MDKLNDFTKFDQFYLKIKGNKWYWYFSIFCRLILAFAFTVAGMVKIVGERFANGLSNKHPMGAYLEALHHTGYYYTFIGIAQVAAAILLLIPRTVTLGALLYFPIIVNIWLLSIAVRFEGSIVTSPLMVLANLYILFWNYDRLKYLLPFKKFPNYGIMKKPTKYSNKFPFLFFIGVICIVLLTVLIAQYGYEALPRNSITDCKKQFIDTKNEAAGYKFCECIHDNGNPLDECLEEFEKATKKTK